MEPAEKRYRALCSLETLRSGRNGFFREFAESAARDLGDRWVADVFARLTTDEDRVRTIFADARARAAVLGTLDRADLLYRAKDAAVSRSRRIEALEAAARGELPRALLLSSQAVLRAPLPARCPTVDRGFGLALALLARAEILLASREPALALRDLRELARLGELPEPLRADLARKRERAEAAAGTGGGEKQEEEEKRPAVPRRASPPSASALLDIEETASAGKRAVARAPIAPGDVLVAEEPLAACLLPEYFGTRCSRCFASLRAPLGCPECSGVAFCGEECREAAVRGFHGRECKILGLLIGSGMSVASMLALRMLTLNGPAESLRICRALRNREAAGSGGRRERRRRLREAERVRRGDEPELDLRAYDLVAHEKLRSPDDFLQRTLMAAFLLRCLQRVGFFAERATKRGETPSEEEIAIGGLLLRHLQLVQFNAHEVFETRRGPAHRFRGSKPVYIGVALYPTVARFNHECYPAVARYFVGQRIVIHATRSLRPGEVVAENYGPVFTKRSAEERRTVLAGRYWFRCECLACRENWPRFDGLTNDAFRLRCPTEGCPRLHRRPRNPIVPCPACGRKVDLTRALRTVRECERLYARGFAAMEEERVRRALRAFLRAAGEFHRVAVPPHRDTHLAEIAASSCMAAEAEAGDEDEDGDEDGGGESD